MLQMLRRRMYREEKGFTLIELLVVILIIGILAAIALPAFLGQREKGQDSQAKSNARNIVSAMESCFSQGQTYAGCDTGQDVVDSGIPVGTTDGTVTIAPNAAVGYTITGNSISTGDFLITKSATGTARTCGPVARANKGGCNGGNW